MARADLLNILYTKNKSPLEFNFDMLSGPSVYQVLPVYAIDRLYNIATSLKYADDINYKYSEIKKIMEQFGFKKMHAGTNRVVYKHYELTGMVAKIAVDRTGMQDNPLEFQNQNYLRPFVTKTFSIDQTGVVAFSERVDPLTNREQFYSVAESIFDLLTNNIIGLYVVEDVGTKFFKNWGLRKGFGPVLLDYPYVFPLDGNKLFCNKQDPLTFQFCGGEIDYDSGFNCLRCTKCGKEYQARDLQKFIDSNDINIESKIGELTTLKARVVEDGKTLYRVGYLKETNTIQKRK